MGSDRIWCAPYQVATVDKGETMKAIFSYLNGQRDTRVPGWWFFNREAFLGSGPYYSLFENYWLNLPDVGRFAISAGAFGQFAAKDFKPYLANWKARQAADLLGCMSASAPAVAAAILPVLCSGQ